MRPTQMLVRHGPEPGGWTWETTDPGAGPRIATLHNVPNLTKVEAVKQTGDLLANLAVEVGYRVGIDPSGVGDVPGPTGNYWLGDRVEVDTVEMRVPAWTIGLDPQRPGRVVRVPELGAVVEPTSVQMARINRRMSAGTVQGRSPVAVPLGQGRGQGPGDAADSGGCCTHVWQGVDTIAVLASAGGVFNPVAPEGGIGGYPYDPAYGVAAIGEGAWEVVGYVEVEFDGANAGGQLTVSGSGPAGGVIGGRATVPAGETTWEVQFFGSVLVAGGASWAPTITFGNGVATNITTATAYFTAQGSCQCLHTITSGGT